MSNTLKNTIIYIVLGFLSPSVNFILIPVYTRYLSPEHYGIITIGNVFQDVLINVLGVGVGSSYSRYYYDKFKDKNYLDILFSTSYLIYIITSIIAVVFLFFTGDYFFQKLFGTTEFTMYRYGWWIILAALVSLLQKLMLSEYRNQERADKYSLLSTVFFLTTVAGAFIGIVILTKGAKGSIVGRSLGAFIPVLIYTFYIFRKRKLRFDKKLSVSLLDYGYPIMIYSLITFFYNNVDKILISKYFDVSTLGLYGFALSLVMISDIFISALSNTFMPKIYKSMIDVNIPHVFKQIKNQYEYIFLAVLLFFAGAIPFSMLGIHWFIDSRYVSTIIWMPLLFLSYIPRVYYVVYSIPVFYYKKTKALIPITTITLGCTILFSLLLMPYFGVFALIMVSFFSKSIQTIGTVLYSKKANIYNDKLYNLLKVHIQYVFLMVVVLIGYLLYYQVWNQNIFYLIYYLIGTMGISFVLFIQFNYEHFIILKQIVLEKFKNKK